MWTTLRFLLCAIPGVLLLLAGMILLGLALDPDVGRRWLYAAGGVVSVTAGVPLLLYGTGRRGQWGYILPFLSLPLMMLLYNPEVPASCAVVAVPFVVAAAVRAYYRRKAPTSAPGPKQ